jgi:hypothetical protein
VRKGSGLRPCTQRYCFAAVLRVTSSPCFAGPYPNTIEAPQRDGTEAPKQHSKSIRAASAASAIRVDIQPCERTALRPRQPPASPNILPGGGFCLRGHTQRRKTQDLVFDRQSAVARLESLVRECNLVCLLERFQRFSKILPTEVKPADIVPCIAEAFRTEGSPDLLRREGTTTTFWLSPGRRRRSWWSLVKPMQARNFKDLKGVKCRYTFRIRALLNPPQ